MKIFLKIIAGLASLVVLAIAILMFITSGMTQTADNFFVSVKSNNYDKAYSYLSEDFKGSISKTELRAYLEKNNLNKFKTANWDTRSTTGARGELEGAITTETDSVIPISLSFIKENDDWLIYSIKKFGAGIQEEIQSNQMPSKYERIELVSNSMIVFAKSIKEQSMVRMYRHISHLWKRQSSIEELNKSFSHLFRLGDALMVVERNSPQFSEAPSIDEDGILSLEGFYLTHPTRLYFKQKYIYEGVDWKLMSFHIYSGDSN